ncbi:MAG: hypothetical protein ACLGIC_01195 [Acidimicrobiia bacterium]
MHRLPLTRRAALVAATALALVAAPFVAEAATTTDAGDDARRAVVDLSGAIDATTTVQAASVPAEATGIGPGSHLLIEMDGGLYGCTASWIHESGGQLLLGAAGHCFMPATATATHGPGADWDPADTQVRVCVSECTNGGMTGFVIQGTTVALGPVAYARQEESKGGEQVGWDFGVVEIPSELHDLVRTTMPVFGGPDQEVELASGDQVCHYGNGIAVGEVWPTMARSGVGILSDADAWYAASPSAPGDSGSAVQTCTPGAEGLEGVGAVGTLTHLTSLGVAGTTNARAVEMAQQDAGLALQVVLGDLPTGGGSTDDGSSDDGSTDDGSTDGGGKGQGKGKGGGKGKPTA